VTTRAARRRRATDAARSPGEKARPYLFGAVVVVVLAVGGFLAFGDFLNRPAAAIGTIDVQSSMAGFTPAVIRAKAGTTVTLDWWTQDASMHLENGVHTMIAPELGLNEMLPAESRRSVTWQVPNMPGSYDVYCDTCCGGKDSPTMHGTILVEV
jgi:plastocyanin